MELEIFPGRGGLAQGEENWDSASGPVLTSPEQSLILLWKEPRLRCQALHGGNGEGAFPGHVKTPCKFLQYYREAGPLPHNCPKLKGLRKVPEPSMLTPSLNQCVFTEHASLSQNSPRLLATETQLKLLNQKKE